MKPIFAAALFLAILPALGSSVFAQSESREELLKEIETKRTELSALEKQFLAPSDEDWLAYAEFLKQPNTGLIRLLPREVYDKDSRLTIRGGGAFYSFIRLTHAYGYGSDIMLEQGQLAVGFAGADFGMLANVGDVPIEGITADFPPRFITAYAPPEREPDAREEARRFQNGLTIDNLRYERRLPARVRTTYLLRSIDYSTSDVLVAFRVIRKDTDGSIIIVWRLLKKYPKPELARNN